jgi:hypothetical protein
MNWDEPINRLADSLAPPSLSLSAGCGMSAGGARFDPGILFANGEQGAWYDPSDLSSMFQDSGGTTPSAVDAVVGLIRDKSGRGNHASQSTTASKPVLRQSGSRYYLEFDGIDDYLATSAIDFSSCSQISVFAGIRKVADTTACLLELTANADTTNGGFYIVPVLTGQVYKCSVGGSLALKNQRNYGPYPAPVTQVITACFKAGATGSSSALSFRVNGSADEGVNASSAADSGNLANAAFYIGRRDGTLLPFTGRVYGMILRTGVSDTASINRAEAWVNAKTGAY